LIPDVPSLPAVMAGTDSKIFIRACDGSGKESAEVELSRGNLSASVKYDAAALLINYKSFF
jgi:hypothetical protein